MAASHIYTPYRAKKCKFYVNGDSKFFGKDYVINPKRTRNMDALMGELNERIRCPRPFTRICTPTGGHRILKLDDLEDKGNYVAVPAERFKKIGYLDMEPRMLQFKKGSQSPRSLNCDVCEYYHPHPGKETCRFYKDAKERARAAGDEESWKLYLDTEALEALQAAELAKSGGDTKSKLDIKPPVAGTPITQDEKIDDLYKRMNFLSDQLSGFLSLHVPPVSTPSPWIPVCLPSTTSPAAVTVSAGHISPAHTSTTAVTTIAPSPATVTGIPLSTVSTLTYPMVSSTSYRPPLVPTAHYVPVSTPTLPSRLSGPYTPHAPPSSSAGGHAPSSWMVDPLTTALRQLSNMADPDLGTRTPVVNDLLELDKRVSEIISSAWASNTLACRNSQWKKFLQFCSDRCLTALPASLSTIVRFLAYLESLGYKYVTINNYMSSLVILHKFYGIDGNFRESYLIKTTLAGLKNRLGGMSTPRLPLSLEQLNDIYHNYQRSALNDCCWLAILISFRTLLRKSNVVWDEMSGHTLLRRDVSFLYNKVVFNVHTTKTRRKGEETLVIPVNKTSNLGFCVWYLLSRHVILYPAPVDYPLLLKPSTSGPSPLLYQDVLKFLKAEVLKLGLDNSRYGLHSLRRSGAMYLQRLGVPLHEIQLLGDWRTMAVMLYLSSSFDRKVEIQELVTANLDIN